jgi:RNA polymerase sigma factor (sigma-70 family)
MPTSPLSVVIQHLMADLGPDGDRMTDGELLARFLRSRDHDALAALVRRHAPMVWGVCCRLLHKHHDAEDAFQAAFLVLVRKAANVPRQAVANWLYGVARQTAVRLRATAATRGRPETQVVTMPEPTVAEGPDPDLPSVLDEELGRLPDHYRGVVVLCDLEGMTRKETARQLGIPEGSVASRLARGRVLLTKRLSRRGFAFSGGPVAVALAAGSASASAPPALVASTIRAASLLAAGRATAIVSARAAALAEGTVKAMLTDKIRSVLALVLVAATVVGAAGVYYRTPAAEQPTAKSEPRAARDDQTLSDVKQIGANPPAQPNQQPAKTDQERIIGWWTIVNAYGARRKGEVWEIGKHQIIMNANLFGFRTLSHFYRLDAAKSPKQIDITVTAIAAVYGGDIPMDANARIVGVIKGIYELDRGELRLCLGEMGKDRPAAFPAKPKPGEVLILHGGSEDKADGAGKEKDKLQVLIDKVLEAHGGEDKLNKLQSFTMTVKHSNGYTNQYFVQQPRNLRWEFQHRDSTTREICILLPHGRQFWRKEPNNEAKAVFYTGAELTMAYWLDHVKFFGPRQVLRLKDADHRVALLDEEARIGDRAAVGVEVIGPQFHRKLYFDKETHLLLRSGPVTYSDYKRFDGIPVAQKENDGYLLPEVTDFRAVDKFDARLFEQP